MEVCSFTTFLSGTVLYEDTEACGLHFDLNSCKSLIYKALGTPYALYFKPDRIPLNCSERDFGKNIPFPSTLCMK